MPANDFPILDLHTHTTFSDGRLTPDEVLEVAREMGCEVGISDHCGRGAFQLEDNGRFDRYLEALGRLPVLRSAEIDLGNEGRVTPDRLARCHYLIGGVHSLNLDGGGGRLDFFDREADPGDPETIIKAILAAIGRGAAEHRFQILAHPGLLPMALRGRSGRLLDESWERGVIELALRHGFVLEISSRWELPGGRLIEKARRAGVRFSLGSDGHGRDRVCRLDYSLDMVRRCGIGRDGLFVPHGTPDPITAFSLTTGPTVSSR